MKTKTMAVCGVFAAVLCVFSVMTVPIGSVPITMGLFGIMLAGATLGAGKGAVSVSVFILLGAVGLPVFSGFKGGVTVLAEPTGGYIWSYIPAVVLIGLICKYECKRKITATVRTFSACLAGTVLCYAFGTAQFMLIQKTDFVKSLSLCVIPFIPFDIAKSAAAAYLSVPLRRALKKSGAMD